MEETGRPVKIPRKEQAGRLESHGKNRQAGLQENKMSTFLTNK